MFSFSCYVVYDYIVYTSYSCLLILEHEVARCGEQNGHILEEMQVIFGANCAQA